MHLGFLYHPIDFIIGKSGRVRDRDGLFLAGALVLCAYVNDTVNVNVKGNFDLRNTAASRRNAVKLEVSERLVVVGHRTLTLQDMNVNCRLVVLCRGEDLRLGCRNRGVARNQCCHDAAECLNTERKRCDIEQENVIDITCDNAALDCGTDSDAFIRVNALVRLLAEFFADCLLNCRNTGGTADQQDIVDITCAEFRITESLTYRNHGLFNQELGHVVKLCTAEFCLEVESAAAILGHCDERK